MLSPQQTVEHLLHHDGVEFDELGESLDDFTLYTEKKNVNHIVVKHLLQLHFTSLTVG